MSESKNAEIKIKDAIKLRSNKNDKQLQMNINIFSIFTENIMIQSLQIVSNILYTATIKYEKLKIKNE